MGVPCQVCGKIDGNHSICDQLLSLKNENQKNIYEIKLLKGKNTEIENSMNSYQSQLNSFQEKENERQEKIKRTQEEINLKILENNIIFIENIKEDIKNELDKFISKTLKDFSFLSPKEILQNIIIKEKIEEKNILKLKEKFGILIKENISSNLKHFNILILGPSGCGKSTLINSLLKLEGKNASPESIGKPCTKTTKIYESSEIKGIRFIDTRGIEYGEYNIDSVISEAKKEIEKRLEKNNLDDFIHCVLYCISSGSKRFQNKDEESLSKLMNLYIEKNLGIIIVLTQSYFMKETKALANNINTFCSKLGRSPIILNVIAKEYSEKNEPEENNQSSSNLLITDELENNILYKPKNLGLLMSNVFKESKKSIKGAAITSINKIAKMKFNEKNISYILKKINELIFIDGISFRENISLGINQIMKEMFLYLMEIKIESNLDEYFEELINFENMKIDEIINDFKNNYFNLKAQELGIENLFSQTEIVQNNDNEGSKFILNKEQNIANSLNYIKNNLNEKVDEEGKRILYKLMMTFFANNFYIELFQYCLEMIDSQIILDYLKENIQLNIERNIQEIIINSKYKE